MTGTKKLSVAEALAHAGMIEAALDSLEETASETVRALGGRDALARISEMTCVGPMPRLSQDAWAAMSAEFEERRGWNARGTNGGAR